MQKLTQKYTLVHLLDDLPDGYEYSMKDWPLHITLADVFAIEGSPENLLKSLDTALSSFSSIKTKIVGEDWFGDDMSVHVKLIEKTDDLMILHDTIIDELKKLNAMFNNPQYTGAGFKPHATVKSNDNLIDRDAIIIDSITLIDMFPDNDPNNRRVMSTIYFKY